MRAWAMLVLLAAAPAIRGQELRRGWVTTVQSGLAETYQLALGGVFGQGPSWQNRVETGISNVWKQGDYWYVYGADSNDLRSHQDNWLAGLSYRRPVWARGRQQVVLGGGLQHWKFRSVRDGSNDWLTAESLTYRYSGRVPFTVTSDSYTVVASRFAKGSLVTTQAWLEHRLSKRESPRIVFRHGPAETYSWGFWGTNGNRVWRYQSMLSFAWKTTRIEGGLRKQWGMHRGIPDNTLWQFSVSRVIAR
ncbi:MAG: hypothetical protein SFV54_26170 [Bryobacteraceae bacterium]|nr:hypothetical protein [Bryobacteraceae bacterium]